MSNLLAGDVGGTCTRLAVFSSKRGLREPLHHKTYANAQYDDFETIVQVCLAEAGVTVERACLGVGGPVVGGRVTFTNRDWVLDVDELRSTFGWSEVILLNDMEALGHGVKVLKKDDLYTLNTGSPVAGGPVALVALGTGLGEGYLTYDGENYHAHGCEGGHTSFGPVGELQIGLLRYLNGLGHAHVSNERVCSGALGLPNVYAYLKSTGLEEPDWLAKRLAETEELTPAIVEATRDRARPCPLAESAVDLFVQILGSEAGNLALKILATGGVYLGGGMALHLLPELKKPLFLEAMRAKGRFRDLLISVPVHVILDPSTGMLGAAAYCLSF
jgi:glucokinase